MTVFFNRSCVFWFSRGSGSSLGSLATVVLLRFSCHPMEIQRDTTMLGALVENSTASLGERRNKFRGDESVRPLPIFDFQMCRDHIARARRLEEEYIIFLHFSSKWTVFCCIFRKNFAGWNQLFAFWHQSVINRKLTLSFCGFEFSSLEEQSLAVSRKQSSECSYFSENILLADSRRVRGTQGNHF